MRQVVSTILFICLTITSLQAQENFFTDDTQDSLATNFYQRNKKVTMLAVVNVPSWQYGVACFLHNADNRASYYFELKMNALRREIISGEECYGEGVRQKEVAYSTHSLTVGLSRGFTRNWFIYGGAGLVVKDTKFDNQVEDNYRYTIFNNGVWFNVTGGAMYVTDSNLSFLLGLDLYDRSLTIGVGYTW